MDSKTYISKMSTVVRYPLNNNDFRSKETLDAATTEILKKVREIVDDLKVRHEKFCDPDFGPNESDEFGGQSLYGPALPAPTAHSKYPNPELLAWERPIYHDKTFDGASGSNVQYNEEGKEVDGDSYEDDEFGGNEYGPGAAERNVSFACIVDL